MQTMEPQHVDIKDIKLWLFQAFELINRRIVAFLLSVTLFFICLFFFSQALVSATGVSSPIVLMLVFLFISAFWFYFSLAEMVMVSYSSDHSRPINPSAIMHNFMPSQKMFWKMAFIGIAIGLCYWFASILMNPEKNVLTSSEQIIALLSKDSTLFYYLFKIGAVFLYFIVLVMFTLRTFFCVPLILFHELSYAEAQALSHRAIMMNIKVMSLVLMLWIITFMLTMSVVPMLAVVFLPLFAAFNYVSYRHIFLGQGMNEKVRQSKESVALSRG